MNETTISQASEVISLLRDKGLNLSTAESCTGGLLSAYFTAVAGSSDVIDRAFVTYSNKAKNEMLGVPQHLIEKHGAVSEQVAISMSKGAVLRSGCDIAISITGIAGPGGGSQLKPVGLVHMCVFGQTGGFLCQTCHFGNIDRGEIREKTCMCALQLISKFLNDMRDT